MTIIIALKDNKNKRILFGSDRAQTCGQIKETCSNKIISKEIKIIDAYYNELDTREVHMGFAGAGFLMDYIDHVFTLPDLNEQQDFIEYLYNDFLDTLRTELMDKKILGTINDIFDSESQLLIIYNGEIYEIASDFSIHCVDRDYAAIGSGTRIAIGSLYTNLHYHSHIDRYDMIKQALTACGVNTIYCDTNLDIQTIQL